MTWFWMFLGCVVFAILFAYGTQWAEQAAHERRERSFEEIEQRNREESVRDTFRGHRPNLALVLSGSREAARFWIHEFVDEMEHRMPATAKMVRRYEIELFYGGVWLAYRCPGSSRTSCPAWSLIWSCMPIGG